MSTTSKSPRAVLATAHAFAEAALPAYAHRFSPKKFTQHQLFAILVLKQFFRTDLRGIVAILRDSSDLRRVLGLGRVPHYSTLSYAQDRFFKGGVLPFAAERGRDRATDRPAAVAK